jgi:hypothetical protein
VTDYEKAVEDIEGDRRHGKEIHGRNGFPVIPQESKPSLARFWIPGRSAHPSGDGSLRNVKAQHKQFAVNARSAPARILCNHAKDQVAQLLGDPLPADVLPDSRYSSPVHLKPGSVPASHRFRSQDDESLLPARPKSASRDPEDPINQTESCSGMPALQDGELLAESQVFEGQAAARVGKADKDCKKDQNEVKHGVLL